ncbi:E3 ubiquitin-protein ligase SIAH1B [Blattella germanica]|nr:E3 ubiquitin-protein ligase SIAH1B [Blattella germanica]
MTQLECPVCRNYMVPPIYICQQRHNICSNCRPKIDLCPTCTQPFTEARNVHLENLARNMHYPCVYSEIGCVEVLPMDLITAHQILCAHRPHICPLYKVPRVMCPWKGPHSEMKAHVVETHNQYLETDDNTQGRTELKDVSEGFKNYKVIFHRDRVFLRHTEVKDGEFFCVLLFVGPEELAEDFIYEVKISSEKEFIVMRNVACSNETSVEEIFESRKCVNLNFNLIKNFITKENTLILNVNLVSEEKKCCTLM